MKMNIILMISGAIIFAVGLIMTITADKPAEKSVEFTNPSTTVDRDIKKNTKQVTDDQRVRIPQETMLTQEEAKPEVKEDPKEKGNKFEDYVANILKDNSIRIKEWNKGSVTSEGAFGENALNPDMFVADKTDSMNLEYWIECKFRSSIPEKGFELEQYQIDRYSAIQGKSKRKILIALGLGGSANNPDRFFIIPLDSIKRFKHIPEKYIINYRIDNPKANFKKEIRDYFFNEVFKKKS